jgi:RimJ/RimL family protein N-acetyltransferase
MKFIELESERLLFRKFKQEDFPIIFDMFSNLENIKYRSGEPKNETETQDYLNWAISCEKEEECKNFKYAVVLKSGNSLIGSCEIYDTQNDPALLAWELHRNYWRQGYGTEIGKTLLKFGFDMLNIRRIAADCNALNRGSYRIMELIGMRREAHFIKAKRGNSVLNYEWCDRFQYAILQEEWLAAKDRK